MSSPLPEQVARGSVLEVFLAFLRLGCTSFGGPIAHLGYFREAFVVRRRWIDDAAYADLVALSQFMPGPASSQVGFALGVLRGNGLAGGLAAWTAFTLPSAILLFIFALTASMFDSPAAMSRCRCSRPAPSPPDVSTPTPSSQAMARPRRCRSRCSPLRSTWARWCSPGPAVRPVQ